MKIQKLLLGAALVILSAACQNQIENPIDKSEVSVVKLVPITFNAQTEDTKTTLDGLNIIWEEGDQINVLDNSSLCDAYGPFEAAGAGASTGFSGLIGSDATAFYALYPYDENAQTFIIDEDNDCAMFETTLAVNQEARKGGLPANTNLAFAKADNNNSFGFHTICSVIKFTLTRSDIAYIEIAGNGDDAAALAGTIDVIIDLDGNVTYMERVVPEGDETPVKSITISSAEGDTFVPGTYYVCALPGTYSRGINGDTCKLPWHNVT